jgi:hypothetical protein
MKIYSLILLLLISPTLFAQTDISKRAKFFATEKIEEAKFISFVKAGQIDSCLSRISTQQFKK